MSGVYSDWSSSDLGSSDDDSSSSTSSSSSSGSSLSSSSSSSSSNDIEASASFVQDALDEDDDDEDDQSSSSSSSSGSSGSSAASAVREALDDREEDDGVSYLPDTDSVNGDEPMFAGVGQDTDGHSQGLTFADTPGVYGDAAAGELADGSTDDDDRPPATAFRSLGGLVQSGVRDVLGTATGTTDDELGERLAASREDTLGLLDPLEGTAADNPVTRFLGTAAITPADSAIQVGTGIDPETGEQDAVGPWEALDVAALGAGGVAAGAGRGATTGLLGRLGRSGDETVSPMAFGSMGREAADSGSSAGSRLLGGVSAPGLSGAARSVGDGVNSVAGGLAGTLRGATNAPLLAGVGGLAAGATASQYISHSDGRDSGDGDGPGDTRPEASDESDTAPEPEGERWSPPEAVDRFDTGFLLGYQHRLDADESRYFVYDVEDADGGVTFYFVGRTGLVERFVADDSEIDIADLPHYSTEDAARRAHSSWVDEEQATDDPGESQTDGSASEWHEPELLSDLGMGWFLFVQEADGGEVRYLVAGETDDGPIYLAPDGTVEEEPHYYATPDDALAALDAYGDRAGHAQQGEPPAGWEDESHPTGSAPDLEEVGDDADENGGGLLGTRARVAVAGVGSAVAIYLLWRSIDE